MTKPVDLEAIKAQLAGRTPGNWELGDGWVYTTPIYDDDRRLTPIGRVAKYADPERQAAERDRVQRDLDLIAHAPEDLAALVAEVERLRGDLRATRTALREALLEADQEAVVTRAEVERLRAVTAAAVEARAAERATHLAKASLTETVSALDRARTANDALDVALDAWRGGDSDD